MRMLSKVLPGSLAIAASVSLGLAGTAQAQTAGPQAARVPLTATPSTVAAGLNTGAARAALRKAVLAARNGDPR